MSRYLSKMEQSTTALLASCFDLKDRGQLKEGYKADITIFDLHTVTEKGKFKFVKYWLSGR